jgi:small conductance mechanosensitive channel
MTIYVRAVWLRAVDFFPKLALALVALIVFLLLARILRVTLRRIAGKSADSGTAQVLRLLASASEVTVFFAGIIASLGIVGVNVSAMVAALGLTGFAVGFALKDALSSLLAGCLILLYRPFQCGQRISVAGSEGVVVEINLRYTALQADGKRILIPNSILHANSISILGE